MHAGTAGESLGVRRPREIIKAQHGPVMHNKSAVEEVAEMKVGRRLTDLT